MTFQHWAGVSSYTSSCDFAETCVFDKQSLGPFHCDLHRCRLPFSRSYGVILPSSLTRVLPFVLHYSYHLPVSVCGTGTSISTLAAFLASVNSSASLYIAPHHRPALRHAYFTTCQPHDLATAFHPRGLTILLCPCFELLRWYGISTCCPSSTPFDLDLGPDLPWVDEPSPGNLRLSTEMIKHFSRYLCRHSLLYALHSPFRYCFCAHTLLLYQLS